MEQLNTCINCANLHKDGKTCRTMKKPFEDYSCWGNKQMVVLREMAIKNYYMSNK